METAVKERKKLRIGVHRILALVLAFAVGIGVGAVASLFWPRGERLEEIEVLDADLTITEEEYVLSIEHVEELVKPASELISTKFFYKDANTYENVVTAFGVDIPFTTDKVVFTYEGVVSLGIDLEKVSYEVDNGSKVIQVTLPEVEIMHNEIDANSFEYPYTSDSIFNSTGMEDYMNLIDTLQSEKEAEVRGNTMLMDEALERAKDTIVNILSVADVSSAYEIVFV